MSTSTRSTTADLERATTATIVPNDRAATRPVVIETEKLTKYYGSNRGIVDLHLAVFEGETFGFLGPNGSGKTTTIRLLMDLIRPTSGKARIFGKDTQAESVAIKASVGYLPGELSLWNNLTGSQILTFLGNLRGGVDPAYVNRLAERLQLDLKRKFREYSKGNKQKVGLVQAFMHRPKLLVLDEPTAGLDPLNQQEFFKIITEAREAGATVFLSSHILSEIEHTCDRVGIVREGKLVRIGPVRDLIEEKVNQVEITFAEVPPASVVEEFSRLPGVSSVSLNGTEMRFAMQGSLDAVLKQAAAYSVVKLTSHEPSLEEAFLHYYRAD